MRSRLLRTALVALGSLLLASVVSAAPKWHTLQAPHCLIVSQLSEKETRLWATQFEQFTAALRGKISIDERFLTPLTVVLFSHAGAFEPYMPLTPDGKPRRIGGFCAHRDSWTVIGVAVSFSDIQTRHIVLHEATHWIASASRVEIPLWLNEGLAEVLSTFQPEKDHYLLGEPDPTHLASLRFDGSLSLFELLLTTGNSPRYTNNKLKGLFYAQSWLFVHKLFFEDPAAGHAILNKFLTARFRGIDQVTALETAYGKSLDAIEKDLEHYSRRGRFTYSKLPYPPDVKVTAPFEPAAPAVVEVALARLALRPTHQALARSHLARASSLDPTAVAPHELLAELEFALGNHAAADTAARSALAAGSRNARMHVIVSHALRHYHSGRGTLKSASRKIADHLAQAIALQPKLRSAYLNYASLADHLDAVTEADAQILVSGYKLYPAEAYLLVGLASVQQRAGNTDEAQRLLDLAFAHPGDLSDKQQATAERLRTEWKIEPLRFKMDERIKQRRYREALTLCEELLQEPMQQKTREFWEKRRDKLRFDAALETARSLSSAGNHAEALRLLEDLSLQPGLDQRELRKVREFLNRIRNSHPTLKHTPASNP